MPDQKPKPNSNKSKALSPTGLANLARALNEAGRMNNEPQMIEAGKKMQALAEKSSDCGSMSEQREAKNKTPKSE